jgi:nicotinamidase-related amidase
MKHKHTLTKSKTALLVIDMQEKFAPAIPDFDNLVTNVTRLVLTFEMFKMPIVVTEQYPEGLGNTVEKIEELFTVLEVVEKMELAATDNAHFMERVNKLGCDTFVVCGIETHVCVNQTVLGLLALGKTVHVVTDAVGSRHSVDQSVGLRKMENAGALITSTETVMFELADRAGTESFKNIQTMVKGAKIRGSQSPQKVAKKAVQQKVAEEKKADQPATDSIKVTAAEPVPPPQARVAPATPAKAVESAPRANAYDDVVDLFEVRPEAMAAPAKQTVPAPGVSPSAEETQEVNLVDLELAEAVEIKSEMPAAPKNASSTASTVAPKTPSAAATKAVGGATHSSSDNDDSTEAVDIEDMISSIDAKIDADEPVGVSKTEVDKDIADLEEIIKADEKPAKKSPGSK